MSDSRLAIIIDSLKEMLYQFDMIIQGFKGRNNAKVIGYICDSIPIEVISSFGLIPLRIPSLLHDSTCFNSAILKQGNINEVYDSLLLSTQCKNRHCLSDIALPAYEFNNPEGYGEAHSIQLYKEIDEFLKTQELPEIKNININHLKEITEEYNNLRRLIRAICTMRNKKPDILSQSDLFLIYEAASVFPPSITIEYLLKILKGLNEIEGTDKMNYIPTLVYSSFISNPSLLDTIEEYGCLILEDDSCNGKRQFDLSFNTASDNLLDEILDAYSYKPLCPSIRPVEERYELFYKLLKSHGIELVIFIEDGCCGSKQRDIDFLRIKLMRSGVDPLVVNSGNVHDRVKDYVRGCWGRVVCP